MKRENHDLNQGNPYAGRRERLGGVQVSKHESRKAKSAFVKLSRGHELAHGLCGNITEIVRPAVSAHFPAQPKIDKRKQDGYSGYRNPKSVTLAGSSNSRSFQKTVKSAAKMRPSFAITWAPVTQSLVFYSSTYNFAEKLKKLTEWGSLQLPPFFQTISRNNCGPTIVQAQSKWTTVVTGDPNDTSLIPITYQEKNELNFVSLRGVPKCYPLAHSLPHRVLHRSRIHVKLNSVSKQIFDKLNCYFKNESPWTKIQVGCDYGISLKKMENPNGN